MPRLRTGGGSRRSSRISGSSHVFFRRFEAQSMGSTQEKEKGDERGGTWARATRKIIECTYSRKRSETAPRYIQLSQLIEAII